MFSFIVYPAKLTELLLKVMLRESQIHAWFWCRLESAGFHNIVYNIFTV